MPGGRPPLGPALVDDLDGPEESKHRLKVILELLAKEKTAAEACAALGIERSRLYDLVQEVLAASLGALAPKKRGRPAAPTPTAEHERIAELERRVAELKLELHAEELRKEIAEVLPHVVVRREAKKKGEGGKKRKPW